MCRKQKETKDCDRFFLLVVAAALRPMPRSTLPTIRRKCMRVPSERPTIRQLGPAPFQVGAGETWRIFFCSFLAKSTRLRGCPCSKSSRWNRRNLRRNRLIRWRILIAPTLNLGYRAPPIADCDPLESLVWAGKHFKVENKETKWRRIMKQSIYKDKLIIIVVYSLDRWTNLVLGSFYQSENALIREPSELK